MRQIHIILLLILSLLTVSCIKERGENTGPDSERNVELRLKIPATSLPAARADDDLKDVKIDEIDLIVFDASGKYLYKRAGRNIVRPSDVVATFTVSLNYGSDLRIYVLVNSRNAIEKTVSLLGGFENRNENDIIPNIVMDDPAALSAPVKALPMSGFLSGITVNYITASLGNINLIRSVARVDVTQDSAINNFILSSASTYFSSNNGRIAPILANISSGNLATAPSLPTSYSTDVKVKAVVDIEGNKSIADKIYIYENAVHLPSAAPKMNTRVVIGGKFDGSNAISYYPVDFKIPDPADESKKIFTPVLRNYRYTINIRSVSGKGYDTEDEASTGTSIDMSATVIRWNDISQDVIFDGENYFHIERKSVILPGNKNLNCYMIAGSNVAVKDWEMSFDGTNYTKDATLSDANFMITKPTADELRLKITTLKIAEDDSDIPVTNISKLYIRVKNLVMEINITQRPDIPADWEDGGNFEWEL